MSRANLVEIAARIALVVISTGVAILLMEFAVRVFYPISIINVEEPNGKADATATADGLNVPDEVLGIRPALGTVLYDDHAILFSRSVFSSHPTPARSFSSAIRSRNTASSTTASLLSLGLIKRPS
jgi:hypothetical protein